MMNAPIFTGPDGLGIDLVVDGKPYHAMRDDPEPFGRDLYARALAGEFGQPLEYPLADARALAVARVKEAAGQLILAKYPQHVQANLTARAVELLDAGTEAGAEYRAILAAWTWIKEVRAESNRLETAIDGATLAEEVTAALATAAWPA